MESDADRFLVDQESRKAKGEWTDPEAGRRQYADWITEWWATMSNLRPSTRARDESYLRSLILPTFGDVSLSSIGQLDVRSWVAALEGQGLAPATVRKAYQILGKTMRAAVDASLIPRTPCRAVPLPQVEQQEMRFLTAKEVATLAEAIHPRYRALVLLGAYGGLRIGEMAGLRCGRVDVLRRRVEVAETLVEVQGRLHLGPPKTRAGRRAVPLPRSVAGDLAEHLRTWAGPDLVFPSPQGGPLRVGLWRRRYWTPAVARAGLPHGSIPKRAMEGCSSCGNPADSAIHARPFGVHGLRHTAVALWIAAGASPKEVAARAGHTSVVTALDRYGHLYEEADEQLTERLDVVRIAATAGPIRDGDGPAAVSHLPSAAETGR